MLRVRGKWGAVRELVERHLWKAGGDTVRVKVPGRMSFSDASWQSPRQVAPAEGGRWWQPELVSELSQLVLAP